MTKTMQVMTTEFSVIEDYEYYSMAKGIKQYFMTCMCI